MPILNQMPQQQRSTMDKLAAGLGGLGAGFSGQSEQWNDRRNAQQKELSNERKLAMAQDVSLLYNRLESGDIEGAKNLLMERQGHIQTLGGDPTQTQIALGMINSGDISTLKRNAYEDMQVFASQGLLTLPTPVKAATPIKAYNTETKQSVFATPKQINASGGVLIPPPDVAKARPTALENDRLYYTDDGTPVVPRQGGGPTVDNRPRINRFMTDDEKLAEGIDPKDVWIYDKFGQPEQKKTAQDIKNEQANLTPAIIEQRKVAEGKRQNKLVDDRKTYKKYISDTNKTIAIIDQMVSTNKTGKDTIHPGLNESIGYLDSSLDWAESDTDAAAFRTLHDQLVGKTFLSAYQGLKGGGSITETEGGKAEASEARITRNQGEESYIQALKDFRADLVSGKNMATADWKDDEALAKLPIGSFKTELTHDNQAIFRGPEKNRWIVNSSTGQRLRLDPVTNTWVEG